MLTNSPPQAPCENSSHALLSEAYTKSPAVLLSPLCPQRGPLVTEACVQVWFCAYLNTDLGAAYSPACGATEKALWPHVSQKRDRNLPFPTCDGEICMLTFLLARNICIYHPLLNEPHLSTIDHSYPSIIKTNILQISNVSATLHLQFCLVPIFYSTSSLIFWNWQSHKMGWNSLPPYIKWKSSEYYVEKFAGYMLS